MSHTDNDLYDTESQLSNHRSSEKLTSCEESCSDISRGGSQWFLSQASEADYTVNESVSASISSQSCKSCYSDENVCSTPVNTSQASEAYSIVSVSTIPWNASQSGDLGVFSASNNNSGFGNTMVVGEEFIDTAHYICDIEQTSHTQYGLYNFYCHRLKQNTFKISNINLQ